MKLSNMFKKAKKVATVKMEVVSKTQLEKVIGGVETVTTKTSEIKREIETMEF